MILICAPNHEDRITVDQPSSHRWRGLFLDILKIGKSHEYFENAANIPGLPE
jgi:hypothetical protein